MSTMMVLIKQFTVLVFSLGVVDGGECRNIKFLQATQNKVLENHVIRSLEVPNEDMCQVHCYQEPDCVSINYGPSEDGKQLCELNYHDHFQASSSDFIARNGFIYRPVLNSCLSNFCSNGGTCQTGFTYKGYRCICPHGYEGDRCESDVNECVSGNHNCHSNADCVNVFGSFQCTCKLGYVGDGLQCQAI